jgi:thiamine-phosphate pyrophosphorylase
MAIPEKVLRIADANLNRIGEGLRFLEEIARLVLNDTALTRTLKDLRHELLKSNATLNQQLVGARDAAGDVGAEIEEGKERDLSGAVAANARRVQQSLRVMEELSKLPDITGLDSEKFKRARFALYTAEKELLEGLVKTGNGEDRS